MPLYDYQCQQCSKDFTELPRMCEMDAPIDCPECASIETLRSVSSFAVGVAASSMPSVSAPSKSPFN